MNLLTFDIEEWSIFHEQGCSVSETRARQDRLLEWILDLLDLHHYKATFFCLGEIARKCPYVIRNIHARGHEIACHSDTHNWLPMFSARELSEDTKRAIGSLEEIIGTKVRGYRAPAFSIGIRNKWALEVLYENGIEYDCSIFPAVRDFGGFPQIEMDCPAIIRYQDISLKEFPICVKPFFRKKIAFSGGGYFRLFPYAWLRKWIAEKNYVMTYFHMHDFDVKQERRLSLRYFKSYYGIAGASLKLERLLHEFPFVNVEQADRIIDWNSVPKIIL